MTDIATFAVVVKATLVQSLGLLCLRLARHRSASARHVIAMATLAASALLPLTMAGLPDLPVALTSRSVIAPAALAWDWSSTALPVVQADLSPHEGMSLSSVVVIAWSLGAGVCLLPSLALLMRTRRMRRAGRTWRVESAIVSTPWGKTRLAIPICLQEGLASPAACGICRPFIVLPLSAVTWSPQDVDRALSHELAHVRRRDVLVQALGLVVCAAYWFDPLVWFLWRQLRLEAERACDDAVLAQFDATDYAAQLVRIARTGTGRTSTLLPAMARRGELTTRVEAILDPGQPRSLRNTALVPGLLAALVSAAVLGAVTPSVAFVGPTASPTPGAFTASTITQSRSNAPTTMLREPDGSVRLRGVTLEALIRLAYGVQAEAILDPPPWARTIRFDLDATPPTPPSANTEVMLQSLLHERFGLDVIAEARLQRILVVTLPARSAGQASPTPCEPDLYRAMHDAEQARRPCGFQLAPGRIDATAIEPEALAATLATALGERVIVERALPGRFDIHLQWRAGMGTSALLDALKTQADATVTHDERRVPVLAVRAASRPTYD